MRITAGLVLVALAVQLSDPPPALLPAGAAAQLARSLEQSKRHPYHVWRDTAALNPDRTVNAYIEIPRGDRRKWEYDVARNARAIDRVMPRHLGGYPVNYGFVPQTISYDGDPFDALVLGPPLPGALVLRGVVVGLMHMEDEKGIDSKVVLSPAGPTGGATHPLTQDARERLGDFFNRYKLHEPGKFSRVRGWGSQADGLAFVRATHAFFTACRESSGSPCEVR